MMQIDYIRSEIDSSEHRADTLGSDAQALLDALDEGGAPDITHLSPEQVRTLLGDLFTPNVDPEAVAEVRLSQPDAHRPAAYPDGGGMNESSPATGLRSRLEADGDVLERTGDSIREVF